jgi:hypothetical protein
VVSAAPFEDRIVHHALCQVIEPIWEARFIHDSYACRVGKGTHAALNRAQHFARAHRYVLSLDICEFFPSIDHAVLRDTLQRHLADPRLLAMGAQIIASGRDILAEEYTPVLFPGDDLLALARPRGLPRHIAERPIHDSRKCPYGSEKIAHNASLSAIGLSAIGYTRRLTLHENRAQVSPVAAGFPFVGWTITPERRRLRRRNVVQLRRRYRQRLRAYAAGDLTFAQLKATVHGWVGHAQQGSTRGLRRAILGQPIPRPAHA